MAILDEAFEGIDRQQEFIDFVLEQYIKAGVGELNRTKLPQLLELKYHTVRDAVNELGSVAISVQYLSGFSSICIPRKQQRDRNTPATANL